MDDLDQTPEEETNPPDPPDPPVNQRALQLSEWLTESENTNEICERSLLIDAWLALEEKPPNVDKARMRLEEILPFDSYSLVSPPEWFQRSMNGCRKPDEEKEVQRS